jgi:predicted NACHT family NTPase
MLLPQDMGPKYSFLKIGDGIDFTNQYPANKVLITCRIAATDYTFEKFTYVEMADFTLEQVQVFARKWFVHDDEKAKRFVDELNRAEHRGLRELAQTPLLLTLLCLNFEETLTFPARRAELYEEALDALLKKWDATRNIKRDEVVSRPVVGPQAPVVHACGCRIL